MSNKILKEWIYLIVEKTIEEAFQHVPETQEEKQSFRRIIRWAKTNDDSEVVKDANAAEQAADQEDWETATKTLEPFLRYQLGRRNRKRIAS
jgi:hypothetical protein